VHTEFGSHGRRCNRHGALQSELIWLKVSAQGGRDPTSGSVLLEERQNISYRYLAWNCFRTAFGQIGRSRGVIVVFLWRSGFE
jgi:hypothetical protein